MWIAAVLDCIDVLPICTNEENQCIDGLHKKVDAPRKRIDSKNKSVEVLHKSIVVKNFSLAASQHFIDSPHKAIAAFLKKVAGSKIWLNLFLKANCAPHKGIHLLHKAKPVHFTFMREHFTESDKNFFSIPLRFVALVPLNSI